MNKVKSIIATAAPVSLSLIALPALCFAASVSYNGATTLSTDTSVDGTSYASSTGSQNALLATGGSSTITNCKISKAGDSSSENADFYGTNAAVLVYNGASLDLNGCTITTSGAHANAVFAYSNGTINISDTKITTSNNNSGGIMVAGGGTINANNLTVSTSGNSSAAIRSDRDGGTLVANDGSYTTSGVGSPAIYSTANITVNDAALTSSASEGVVIEGANSVTLNNSSVTDTNTTLNGNSETYKNIFLYQSMSGDASTGNATFSATESSLTTNKGDTFFVTNTTATINLTNNTILNSVGDFLRIQSGKWGTQGSNGGNVTLNLDNQKVSSGNIVVDKISSLAMSLKNKSVFKGAIDTSNQAKKISLNLSKDSTFVLTADSYVDTLTNAISDNSNIYLNGHMLYVNGTAISGNTDTYTEPTTDTTDTTATDTAQKSSFNPLALILCIAGGILVAGVIAFFVIRKIKKGKKA